MGTGTCIDMLKSELNIYRKHKSKQGTCPCVFKPIYRDILGIDLGDIKDLYKSVLIRHDLVHRNGKDKDGNEHEINEAKVRELLTSVNALIQRSEAQLVQNPTPDAEVVSSTELQFELPF